MPRKYEQQLASQWLLLKWLPTTAIAEKLVLCPHQVLESQLHDQVSLIEKAMMWSPNSISVLFFFSLHGNLS